MMENPMVTGEYPYNIPFVEDPETTCPSCGVDMYNGETMYELDGDWMCEECLEERINKITPKEWASITGESIEYAEQMKDEGMLEALDIGKMTIEPGFYW